MTVPPRTAELPEETLKILRDMQRNESTDAVIYARLGARTPGENGRVLARIAAEEEKHARIWSKYTNRTVEPNRFKVWFFLLLGALFGLTFVVNLLEGAEKQTQHVYEELKGRIPEAQWIQEQEEEHEARLIAMIDEERLRYIGSMVLGLNDALVELTGALAGFTLALGDTRTVGLAGLITGIAATLSMAASEYLSNKAEGGENHPLKASVYTGIAYLITVVVLLLPYFVVRSPLTALFFCLVGAATIIFVFTFFVSVVHKKPFRPAFFGMIAISFGVALISFLIGWAAKRWLGVEA